MGRTRRQPPVPLRLAAGAAALTVAPPAARAEHARMARLIEKAAALSSIGQRIDFIRSNT